MNDVRKQIEKHLPALQRYAMSLAYNPTTAQDLVQECAVRALSKAHLYNSGSNLRAWLFTILHNLHISEARQRAKWPSVQNPEDAIDRLAVQPAQPAATMLNDVGDAMAQLPKQLRRVLMSVGVEGKTYEEVSQEFHIPIGTVKSRCSRARQMLHHRLNSQRKPVAASI